MTDVKIIKLTTTVSKIHQSNNKLKKDLKSCISENNCLLVHSLQKNNQKTTTATTTKNNTTNKLKNNNCEMLAIRRQGNHC